ncbi:MAG TPA: sulfatase-like hydrolase/transferase [Candidatus Blautia merdavium]|uniref:Sulfatase-like hydrolase/transferase n=1 Tax=Candidatus Blautia merdavium TaxID=2838494 RepID=A0A9D2PNN7_9FIRM|nr:sulfatase-like hydrolase/transferase [Candidatus Blautia merdavium]
MEKKPNFIVIMTDDQGYGDLSCMGNTDFVTPNIDSLAKSGVRFTDWYAGSPVCSPSRACLMTGRYPGNAGVRAILAGHRKASGLTPKVPTLASALKKEGYQTNMVGKWHLGLAEECRPNRNGYDYFYGFMAGCIDYYSHIFYWGMADGHTNPTHDLWENDREIYDNGEYFTDLVTRKAVERIRVCGQKEEPFFLFVGYNAPHYPMHAPRKYMDRFAHLPWDRQVMAAMISAVDDGVGDIVDELKRQGIYENTCIFYQSDNGPSRESRNWMDGREDPYYGGLPGGLKGHKYSLFEGGIRVPGIFSYPGKVPGNQVIHEPCGAMDIFPTLLKEAGGNPGDYELDGRDIMEVMTQGASSPHREIFWEMEEQTAVRRGDYKLVLNGVLEEGEGIQDPVFLSDLSKDPSESRNLAEELPELTRELTEQALAWRNQLEENWQINFAPNYRSLT